MLQQLDLSLEHPALQRALTRRAWLDEQGAVGADHQVLEFVGDAVLGVLVSDALADRFPDATEGALTATRSALVDAVALARLARALDIAAYVRMGAGEREPHQVVHDKLLSDHLEAVIGAIYQTWGLDRAGAFVRLVWDGRWPEQLLTAPQDAKSVLNQLCQTRWNRPCGRSDFAREERYVGTVPQFRSTVTLPDGARYTGAWSPRVKDAEESAASVAVGALGS